MSVFRWPNLHPIFILNTSAEESFSSLVHVVPALPDSKQRVNKFRLHIVCILKFRSKRDHASSCLGNASFHIPLVFQGLHFNVVLALEPIHPFLCVLKRIRFSPD
ncbi:MAG: hypothetical protein CM1200mP16_04830 [Nitrospina sp.]|nr:MAG: hypothetical protein CM1200mP16_04830 [Nitrospina sp.]